MTSEFRIGERVQIVSSHSPFGISDDGTTMNGQMVSLKKNSEVSVSAISCFQSMEVAMERPKHTAKTRTPPVILITAVFIF